jgi:hypothetical protein
MTRFDIASVCNSPGLTRDGDQVALAVTELAAAVPRLQAHLLRLVAEVDRSDLATGAGVVNTAGWLRGRTRIAGPDASRAVGQARGLDAHDATRAALHLGKVQLAQAAEVIHAVEALPGEVADQRAAAEQQAGVGSMDRRCRSRCLLSVRGAHCLPRGRCASPARASRARRRARRSGSGVR